MKRSSSTKLALTVAVAAAGISASIPAVAAPYVTYNLVAKPHTSSTLDTNFADYSATIAPTSVGQVYDWALFVTLAPAGTTNTQGGAGATNIAAWSTTDQSATGGLSALSFNIQQTASGSAMQADMLQTGAGGGIQAFQAAFKYPSTAYVSYTTAMSAAVETNQTGAYWFGNPGSGPGTLSGVRATTGSHPGTIALRPSSTFHDANDVVAILGLGAFGAVTPGTASPLVLAAPVPNTIIGGGSFAIGQLGTTSTLNMTPDNSANAVQIYEASIQFYDATNTARTVSIDQTKQDNSVSAGDPLIHFNPITITGTTAGPTPSTIVVTPASGTLASGGTVNVANTAGAGSDTVTLSSVNTPTTNSGTSPNGSWSRSGLSTTPINPGSSQTGTYTANFNSGLLIGAKLTGSDSFNAAGTSVTATSGTGTYTYTLSATNPALDDAAVNSGTTTFGTAHTAGVASGDKVAGLASHESNGLQNTLKILDGTAQPADAVVSVAWRSRSSLEAFPGTSPPLPANIISLITDVADVNLGTLASRPTAVVIDMNYNPSSLGGASETFAFQAGRLYLAHMAAGPDNINGSADDTWANAGTGAGVLRAYQPSDLSTIGTWGVDTVNHEAWAVVSGSIGSQFAVVPEPASLGLLALGALGLLRRRK